MTADDHLWWTFIRTSLLTNQHMSWPFLPDILFSENMRIFAKDKEPMDSDTDASYWHCNNIIICFKKKVMLMHHYHSNLSCSCTRVFKKVILHKVWLWYQFSEVHRTLAFSVITVPECGAFQLQLHLHWRCQRRVLGGCLSARWSMEGHMVTSIQNACLTPSSAFIFLFLMAGSDLLTFLSNPIKKLSERH